MIKRKTCIHPECKILPSYNKEDETKALYCSIHKLDGMVNICEKRKCTHEENGSICKKRASFNKEGEKKALYCSIHKLEGMVNVISKRCIHEENGIRCKTIPTYNIDGGTEGLYCNKHKLEGMVDIKHKTCIHEENGIICKTRPTFNKEGKKKALYCSIHKLEDMVNVTDKKCIHEGCKTQPSYSKEAETKALYCSLHKLDGMVDVKHKTCIHEGCKTRPIYNIDGGTEGLYCNKHKLDGMVDVVNINKICIHEGSRAIDKYDGYCMHCYMNLFPYKPVSRNYKTKERSVVEFVTTKFPDFTWVADKHVSGGCSKRRPDLLLDLGDQIIIVEVDENQHIDYDCSCENKRIMELSQDVGHRPIVFIRFNPDNYIDENGNKISSCWGQDGNGICVIKKSKKVEWERRLQQLNDQIQYWSNTSHITNKTVEVVQLFYDMNLDEDDEEYEE